MTIEDITGNIHEINGCMGCEIVNGNLHPYGGILYENEHFIITQDFELPIEGFIIITSKRHISKFVELTDVERLSLINLIHKTLSILERNNIAEEYNIILEEKPYHFHVWLMPRHKWMIEKFGKIIKNIKPIQDYAITNMKTKENINKICKTCEMLKLQLKND